MDIPKINEAVNECLQQCCASSYPLATLAEYLADLDEDLAWSRLEIDAVELRALRVLSRLISQPHDAGGGAAQS
jgi:hypothetical protein